MPDVEYLITFTFHLDVSRSRLCGLPDKLHKTIHVNTDGSKEGLARAIYAESSKFFGGTGVNLRFDETALQDNSKLDPSRLYIYHHMIAYLTSTSKRLTGLTPGLDRETGEQNDEEVILQ